MDRDSLFRYENERVKCKRCINTTGKIYQVKNVVEASLNFKLDDLK